MIITNLDSTKYRHLFSLVFSTALGAAWVFAFPPSVPAPAWMKVVFLVAAVGLVTGLAAAMTPGLLHGLSTAKCAEAKALGVMGTGGLVGQAMGFAAFDAAGALGPHGSVAAANCVVACLLILVFLQPEISRDTQHREPRR